MVVWPGWMGVVLARLLGLRAAYCSGAVVPVPLPAYAAPVALSVRTYLPPDVRMPMGVLTGSAGPVRGGGGEAAEHQARCY